MVAFFDVGVRVFACRTVVDCHLFYCLNQNCVVYVFVVISLTCLFSYLFGYKSNHIAKLIIYVVMYWTYMLFVFMYRNYLLFVVIYRTYLLFVVIYRTYLLFVVIYRTCAMCVVIY
jgi:hypothetical protein